MNDSLASRRPIRVLIVGPRPPPINGMSYAVDLMIAGLSDDGWCVRVVDTADKTEGRRTGTFSLGRLITALCAVLAAWRSVFGVDLVYVPVSQSRLGFLKDAFILLAARLVRRPVVVHLHGGNFDRFYASVGRAYRFAIRLLLSPARAFIVLSESLTDSFSMIPGASGRTLVVPNACNLAPLPPRRAPSGTIRLLYLSNLIVEKGYLDVIEAIPALAEQLPGLTIELDIAGMFVLAADRYRDVEEMEADLRARCARWEGIARVKWHGAVRGAEKEELLRRADIFLLPTYYAAEGQPIAIIEALTAALPVIATNYRSIPDTLPQSMHWAFVSPRSPADIADRVARLVREPRLYEDMSLAAADAARQFRPELHVERMKAVLRAAYLGNGTQ